MRSVGILSVLFLTPALSQILDPPELRPPESTPEQCYYCTVPEGYTSEHIDPPLGVTAQFSPRWQDAHAKAASFLQGWSVEEKVSLVSGSGLGRGNCIGNTVALPARNWTGLCLQDSPLGVRLVSNVSAFPAGINIASTFDKDLIYQRGRALGEEFRGKGVHVALGPMTNIMRIPVAGRNWEGFGGDPVLSGWATHYTVKGMQDAGVQAVVKHFVGNEQERNRTKTSSNINDRVMREVYAHPFLRAVQADVASVMSSYNLINGSWASQNAKTLNGILKTDFGFAGYVMSDWGGTHSGVQSIMNGLDMDMPGDLRDFSFPSSYFNNNLTAAVRNGSIPQARLDDMAQRVMAGYFLVGQDKGYPPVSFNFIGSSIGGVKDVQGNHRELIRQIGAASTVLLKNVNDTLPLQNPKVIAVIGNDMGASSKSPNAFSSGGVIDGTLAMGWGSGTANYPYLIDPLQAIQRRALCGQSQVVPFLKNWDLAGAAQAAKGADVALVGINSDSGELVITAVDGNLGDRNNLSAWHNGDALVKAVADVNTNTVVVVHSVGPIDMEQWIDHPNVKAVLWAGLPGQESGNSLVDVLYGSYNPVGRLPYTIAKKRGDYPADLVYVNSMKPPETQVNYTEGLFIDYRHFQKEGITPRFWFGEGLSYTKFEYSNLQVESVNPGSAGTDNKIGSHLASELHDTRWRITATVHNTGARSGGDIPQLYVAYPEAAGEPPRLLRDFSRVSLDPGASATVEFNLSRYDISVWDVVQQAWIVPEGQYKVTVAHHAGDDKGLWGDLVPSGKCQT